jgi:hypothetical protein
VSRVLSVRISSGQDIARIKMSPTIQEVKLNIRTVRHAGRGIRGLLKSDGNWILLLDGPRPDTVNNT